ncbi:MAG: DUF234 domain-containing protein [Microbacter sp.]
MFVKEIVKRDYATFSGHVLEKYFTEKLLRQESFSKIGSYWEKANQNGIDIVAINAFEKRMVIAEVKRNADNISIPGLQKKAEKITQQFPDYQIEFTGFLMDDM